MSLDVFTDSTFAGLHWSIPPDTPDEYRGLAHLAAACRARAERDKNALRPVSVAYDPTHARHLLLWANGSLTWMSEIQIAAAALRVVK